jgi:hypothetical protein
LVLVQQSLKDGALNVCGRFISDKCCGLLLRARKYKLLTFQGEMLFQVGLSTKQWIFMKSTLYFISKRK